MNNKNLSLTLLSLLIMHNAHVYPSIEPIIIKHNTPHPAQLNTKNNAAASKIQAKWKRHQAHKQNAKSKEQRTNQRTTALIVQIPTIATNPASPTNEIATQLSTERFSPLPQKPQTRNVFVVNPNALAQFYKKEDDERMRQAIGVNNQTTSITSHQTYTSDSANWAVVPYSKPTSTQLTMQNYSITGPSNVVVSNKEQLKEVHKARQAAITQSKAATKIQAQFRGGQARQMIKPVLNLQPNSFPRENDDFSLVNNEGASLLENPTFTLKKIMIQGKLAAQDESDFDKKTKIIADTQHAVSNLLQQYNITAEIFGSKTLQDCFRYENKKDGQLQYLPELMMQKRRTKLDPVSAKIPGFSEQIERAQNLFNLVKDDSQAISSEAIDTFKSVRPYLQPIFVSAMRQAKIDTERALQLVPNYTTPTPPSAAQDPSDTSSDDGNKTDSCTIS